MLEAREAERLSALLCFRGGVALPFLFFSLAARLAFGLPDLCFFLFFDFDCDLLFFFELFFFLSFDRDSGLVDRPRIRSFFFFFFFGEGERDGLGSRTKPYCLAASALPVS